MELPGWVVDQKVAPDAELRQGDLVEFSSPEPLRRHGIIVTADCDLRQRKHGRLITLVPVVEVIDVVECYLLLELCDRSRDALMSFVSKAFGTARELTPEAVAELRVRVDAMAGNAPMSTACLAAKLLMHDVDRLKPADFGAVMAAAGVKTASLPQRVEQMIQSKGDLMLLPSLLDLGIKSNIAWVRQVWQAPLKSIAFRTSEVGDVGGQKVARLESPYRYRLTQLMAQVFSDIGLPDHKSDLSAQLQPIFS